MSTSLRPRRADTKHLCKGPNPLLAASQLRAPLFIAGVNARVSSVVLTPLVNIAHLRLPKSVTAVRAIGVCFEDCVVALAEALRTRRLCRQHRVRGKARDDQSGRGGGPRRSQPGAFFCRRRLRGCISSRPSEDWSLSSKVGAASKESHVVRVGPYELETISLQIAR